MDVTSFSHMHTETERDTHSHGSHSQSPPTIRMCLQSLWRGSYDIMCTRRFFCSCSIFFSRMLSSTHYHACASEPRKIRTGRRYRRHFVRTPPPTAVREIKEISTDHKSPNSFTAIKYQTKTKTEKKNTQNNSGESSFASRHTALYFIGHCISYVHIFHVMMGLLCFCYHSGR